MKIPIGLSACLYGEKVRYDGSHQRSAFCMDVLESYFDYRRVCPEMAIGLGVPRETIRVVNDNGQLAVTTKNGTENYHNALTDYADQVMQEQVDLCGFIVMKGSPSCGMERVKQYTADGNLYDRRGMGAFTRQLLAANPLLPVEENGRLHDAGLRENFILRVYALHDWRTSVAAAPSAQALLGFHSRYKYVLMAHKQSAYRELGRLVAALKNIDIAALCDDYISRFMAALAKPAGRKGNTNVLMHIQGYLKRDLNKSEKAQLSQLINQYRKAVVPLITPLSLLKFLLEQHPNAYLEQQAYLAPYPDDLALRSAI